MQVSAEGGIVVSSSFVTLVQCVLYFASVDAVAIAVLQVARFQRMIKK